MHIICHRGFWGAEVAQNSLKSFEIALDKNWGIETDIRDLNGELVISHDIPTGSPIKLSDLLELYKSKGSAALLALNIKSDGLAAEIKLALSSYQIENYFCFDMSVPDMRQYSNLGIKFASRHSDVEPHVSFEEEAMAIWIDSLIAPEIDLEHLPMNRWLASGKELVFVSPELHKNHPQPFWEKLRTLEQKAAPQDASKMHICVDYFEEAKKAFGHAGH